MSYIGEIGKWSTFGRNHKQEFYLKFVNDYKCRISVDKNGISNFYREFEVNNQMLSFILSYDTLSVVNSPGREEVEISVKGEIYEIYKVGENLLVLGGEQEGDRYLIFYSSFSFNKN